MFWADSLFEKVSCTQHIWTLRWDNSSTISADLPLIVPTLRVTIRSWTYCRLRFLVWSACVSPWPGFWVFIILSLLWYNVKLFVFEAVFTAGCPSCRQPTIRRYWVYMLILLYHFLPKFPDLPPPPIHIKIIYPHNTTHLQIQNLLCLPNRSFSKICKSPILERGFMSWDGCHIHQI